MTNQENKANQTKPTAGASRASAESLFKQATDMHHREGMARALNLYAQIIEQFPNHPKADIAKTIVSGFRKEQIGTYWNAAKEARSACKHETALGFYRLIIQEFPDSEEANNAKAEIKNMSDILPSWNAALSMQAKGEEQKAIGVYQELIKAFPYSPESDNTRLLISIMQQNQFMPQGESSRTFDDKESTPQKIIAFLEAHKKATKRDLGAVPPDVLKSEQEEMKTEQIWLQATELEKGGRLEDSALLLNNIISTSRSGYRVRDAKYLLEKIESRLNDLRRTGDQAAHWGLMQDAGRSGRRNIRFTRTHALILAMITAAIAALFLYRSYKPATWIDVVENAKRSIVVVRTASGAGTGFLSSSGGLVLTNASLIGKEKDVEVRLYSGALKKAEVIKVGVDLLDIAVLKIEGTYKHYLSMSLAGECHEGDEIRAIGAPLGIEYFITKGIISHCSLDRDGVRYIQTDTAINVGNSGGPCLNIDGKVVGLSTTINLGDGQQGLNLILPTTVIKDFMENKLAALEEALIKKEQEKVLVVEQENKQFYADVEKIYKKLQYYSDTEYNKHAARLDGLFRRNAISYDEGQKRLEQFRFPPWGPPSMPQWLHGLALKVVKKDMSEEAAIKLIKTHYERE